MRILALCVAVLLAAAVSTHATECPINPPELAEVHTQTQVYGCILGQNWGGSNSADFPKLLTPTYEGSQLYQQLDTTLPIYVVWWNSFPNPEPILLDPPVPITAFIGTTPPCDRLTNLVAEFTNEDAPLYTECASGAKFENPLNGSKPVNADGTIRVRDIFGGIPVGTFLKLQGDFDACGPTDGARRFVVVIAWNNPGSYFDAVTQQTVHAVPGTVVNFAQFYEARAFEPQLVKIYVPQLTVMWASGDFTPTSPRAIDASDLSRFVPYLGSAVTWGHGGGAHNFEFNVNPFGTSLGIIDNGDLATMANHLSHCCSSIPGCRLPSKAGDDEKSAILTWFGLAKTGGDVVAGPNGERIPEYAVVDLPQHQRAIADPYGYRRSGLSSLTEAPWSTVKTLYR